MRKWTKEHARFVGRVIFANFLKIPLERYKNIIGEVEGLFYREGGDNTTVTVRCLSKAKISNKKGNRLSKLIAEIVKNSKGFCIRYNYEGFNKIYTNCGTSRSKLFCKLRRISSRNELTHRIIKGIIEHQKKFLSTGNPIDLVPFSQIELSKWLNGKQSSKTDFSWVSRLVNGISVITPSGEERILKSFFLTQRDINKRLIKQLLDKENEDIETGMLKRPLTDNQIRAKLESEHGLSLSRQSVGQCRKDMGILPAKRRLSGYKYPPLSLNFSVLYSLTLEEVLRCAPSSPGIYELQLKCKEIEYPNSKTQVIYIGSTRNIKKRLREHLGRNNKNSYIKNFLKKLGCSFRYIQFSKNWRKEEKKLYSLFTTTYGAPPKCNRVSP